jgi:ATP-dependent DNA helicase RecG
MSNSILDLTASINTLNNIAGKTSEKLNKLGIYRVIDLLFYFPINIIQRTHCENIKDLKQGQNCIIKLKILDHKKLKSTLNVLAQDSIGEVITINFFSTFSKYLNSYLPINEEVVILGVPQVYNGKLIINHPEKVLKPYNIKLVSTKDVVYKQYQDLTSLKIKGYITQALKILEGCTIPEWLDEHFIKQNNFKSFKESIKAIHSPQILEDISKEGNNILRLSIDEMLSYHLALLYVRKEITNHKSIEFKPDNSLNKIFLKSLPFQLTQDQISALKEIKEIFSNQKQNTLLLQGDVGSGKTVVCFISSIFTIESGYQVAFMAPTEVLATQHYNFFLPYAEKLGLNIALLKGKETKKNKSIILENLESGKTNILIGTHAIFQDSIKFANLGLAIVDEQHKFGVNQRLQLTAKGEAPNLILTTATPIPRTLALAQYGDIKSLAIKNKPQNRKEIITKSLAKNKIADLIPSLQDLLNKKEKIFWVCPLIEESEKMELTSSLERFEWLKKHINHPNIYIIHGKMKAEEKNNILLEFKNNTEGGILVSTTVIEVGIDIPSCNNIIIEDADKFGLAQLHQLRGRVGRGEQQGICLLLYGVNISKNGKKRLHELKNSNDGFYLAEKDLEIRGYGDIIGTAQSGSEFFKITNLEFHANYLLPSLQYAKLLFEKKDQALVEKNISLLFRIYNKDFSINYTKL